MSENAWLSSISLEKAGPVTGRSRFRPDHTERSSIAQSLLQLKFQPPEA
jgi:hypothetical protein